MKYLMLSSGQPVAVGDGENITPSKEITEKEYRDALEKRSSPVMSQSKDDYEKSVQVGTPVLYFEQTPKNQAWEALRYNADLDGNWPELKAALKKAVDSLGEDATAAEIYDKSIELLD